MSDHEEEFYYQEVAVDHMSSPPTLSHRDMARPPHEDPEYQKQLRLEAASATNSNAENMMVGIRERNAAFAISQSPVRTMNNVTLGWPRPMLTKCSKVWLAGLQTEARRRTFCGPGLP